MQQNKVTPENDETVTPNTSAARAESHEQQAGQLPVAEILHCYLIETNQELFKSSGDSNYINETKFMALKDSCSQVTLFHSDIISPEYILKGESLTVKGIGAEIFTMAVAEVPIRYQGWKGVWRARVADQLPVPCLTGIYLTEHIKNVLVQTCSQQKEEEKGMDKG